MAHEFPRLILQDWQDGDDELIKMKGWFCHNFVELENGDRYQICFYDHVRLGQELEENNRAGRPFFIENALIILTEVTLENIRAAIIQAENDGFFRSLKPVV
jgi:hypothetical protein